MIAHKAKLKISKVSQTKVDDLNDMIYSFSAIGNTFYYYNNTCKLIALDLLTGEIVGSLQHKFKRRITTVPHCKAIITAHEYTGLSIYNKQLQLIFQGKMLFNYIREKCEKSFLAEISKPYLVNQKGNTILLRDWEGALVLFDVKLRRVVMRYRNKKVLCT